MEREEEGIKSPRLFVVVCVCCFCCFHPNSSRGVFGVMRGAVCLGFDASATTQYTFEK